MQEEPEAVSKQDASASLDGHGPAPSESELERLTEQVAGLEAALLTRDLIGQAKGILMERYRITEDEAFERLRAASQHKNRKLRELAEELARSGNWEASG